MKGLLSDDAKEWDIHFVYLVIPPPIIGLIQQLPISLLQAEDRLIWRLSPNGVYFVKTGYKAIMNFGGYFEQWKVKGEWDNYLEDASAP